MSKTAYDKLIDKVIIEEDYKKVFENYNWKKLEKRFNQFLKEFNLMVT